MQAQRHWRRVTPLAVGLCDEDEADSHLLAFQALGPGGGQVPGPRPGGVEDEHQVMQDKEKEVCRPRRRKTRTSKDGNLIKPH